MDFGISSSVANSYIKSLSPSLIKHISEIQSNSFQIKIKKTDIFSDSDMLRFSIEQPHRIDSGSITLRLPGLASTEGIVPYKLVSADLEPFGRQINININYLTVPKENFALSINTSLVKDNNHIKDKNINYYTTLIFKRSF